MNVIKSIFLKLVLIFFLLSILYPRVLKKNMRIIFFVLIPMNKLGLVLYNIVSIQSSTVVQQTRTNRRNRNHISFFRFFLEHFRSPVREARSMSIRRASNIYGDQQSSYYFVTQCWIEPQDGFVETNTPELKYLNQCTYKEIVDKVSTTKRIQFSSMSE